MFLNVMAGQQFSVVRCTPRLPNTAWRRQTVSQGEQIFSENLNVTWGQVKVAFGEWNEKKKQRESETVRVRERGKRVGKLLLLAAIEHSPRIFLGFKCDVCISSDRRVAFACLKKCRLVCLLIPCQSSSRTSCAAAAARDIHICTRAGKVYLGHDMSSYSGNPPVACLSDSRFPPKRESKSISYQRTFFSYII